MTDRLPLGDTGWQVWADGVLRSTGFPADGLDRLSAPSCAAAADDLVDAIAAKRWRGGSADAVEKAQTAYADSFAAADLAGSAALSVVAADPLLREAVTWQNREFLDRLDSLRDGDPADRGQRRRTRERTLVRYWQRYCGKNETVGFFGPVCWLRFDPAQTERVRVTPGPELVRYRAVYLERWCVDAYARRLGDDPASRRLLAPTIAPHVHLDGRQALLPARAPVTLSAAEATALGLADGTRTATVIAGELTAQGHVRTPEDAFLLLDRLAERDLLDDGGTAPVEMGVEDVIGPRLAAIPGALAGLDRLRSARDQVAKAAGDPAELAVALSALDDTVAAEIGGPARQHGGDTYAGRTPCHEETVRDVDVVFGPQVLADLAPALGIVLQAARWVTGALADAYRAALTEIADDPGMRLGDLMYLAQGLFWTGDDRPVDTVATEFAQRWAALFEYAEGDRRVERTAAGLAARAAELFAADRPGWSAGRTHSPDLQICADSPEAINRGEYLAVLGEMHTARSTLEFFIPWHADPARMWGQIAADGGADRLRPLYPTGWPRHTGRVSMSPGPYGRRLGFYPAPRPATGDVLPAMAVRLERRDGVLEAVEPDGRRWPIVEVFSEWLAVHSVDAFKLPAGAAHQPRITVDRLVVARETWRTTAAGTGLSDVVRDADRFVAARRLRRRLDLPDRVFVKIGTEIKPCYADLTSPHSVATLAAMIRSAAKAHGPDVPVTIGEALPGTADAWLPDAQDRRYFTELRIQITDPKEA
ncbi:lantibiotic dehydratase [Hamadaea sp. NPDC051192]|uniref:lantibiotic dehydratase n=1 Tax=Hamadaea sp. NPDC051192 TaxID=3154940 RepID=UPI0034317618